MSLQQAVADFCSQHGYEKTYFIAYSGGLDSHVLLSLLSTLRHTQPLKLRAIHINHGLSPHAALWEQHCVAVCAACNVELVQYNIQLERNQSESIEAMAREQRYAAMFSLLKKGDMLLTAHHQDDQAETVLLQLLRGAGPKGLAAMPISKFVVQGIHGRPLLNFPRSALETYAAEKKLQWIEDESNQQLKYARNFIRHRLLPCMTTRFPAAAELLTRSARHCAEADKLLAEYAAILLQQTRGVMMNTLSLSALIALSAPQQRLVLRAWINEQGHPLPTEKKLATLQQQLLQAAADRMPCVRWQSVEVRRYRDAIYLMPCLPLHDANQVITWNLSQDLPLATLGTLCAHKQHGSGFRADLTEVTVRFRQGGEVVHHAERGRLTLKNLFQEWGVLPWLRDRLPLIFVGEKLIAVLGYFVDAAYVAKGDEEGIVVDWWR